MAEPEGWIRLHPLSPLLFAGRFVLLILVGTMQLFVDEAFDSAPGFGVLIGVGVALLVGGILALAYAAVAWRFRTYRVTSELVELKTGVLFRSYRHLPFGRIESVDTAQPIVPRLLGLAEVRIEAISTRGNELRLRYLAADEAERLRLELDARRRSDAAVHAPDGPPPRPPTASSLILKVPTRELVMGYFVIPALAAGLVLTPVVIGAVIVAGWLEGFVVIAVPVLGGVLPGLVRFERLWDFRLEDSGDALVVNRGLLNLSTQRIVTGRVQALRIEQPLLWRPYERFRVVVDVAGYRGAANQAAAASANLLPIAPFDVVRYLVDRLEMHVDLAALAFQPVPMRARWRSLRWQSLSVAWTQSHAVVRSGMLWRQTTIVPHQRLQSARVVQGPWQRRLGLATLRLDTAGSRLRTNAAHRDADEAVDLAHDAAERSGR